MQKASPIALAVYWDWIVCQLTGRSPVLLRCLTQPYEEAPQEPLIETLQWHRTPFVGDLWDQEFLSCAAIQLVTLTTDKMLVNCLWHSTNCSAEPIAKPPMALMVH